MFVIYNNQKYNVEFVMDLMSANTITMYDAVNNISDVYPKPNSCRYFQETTFIIAEDILIMFDIDKTKDWVTAGPVKQFRKIAKELKAIR